MGRPTHPSSRARPDSGDGRPRAAGARRRRRPRPGAALAAVLGASALAAAALGAAGAIDAAAAPDAMTAPPAAACRPARLTVKMTVTPGSGAAGHIGYTLAVRNAGPGRCRLGNHPRLRLLAAGGAALPTHVVRLGASAAVTIAAGHTAKSSLFFSPDVPSAGESTTGPCEPVAHKVRVTLTGPAAGSRVGPVSPPTSVCEHGSIEEKPLH